MESIFVQFLYIYIFLNHFSIAKNKLKKQILFQFISIQITTTIKLTGFSAEQTIGLEQKAFFLFHQVLKQKNFAERVNKLPGPRKQTEFSDFNWGKHGI